MDYKIISWWDSLPEVDKNLFIENLYNHSEDFGFLYDDKTEHYNFIE